MKIVLFFFLLVAAPLFGQTGDSRVAAEDSKTFKRAIVWSPDRSVRQPLVDYGKTVFSSYFKHLRETPEWFATAIQAKSLDSKSPVNEDSDSEIPPKNQKDMNSK